MTNKKEKNQDLLDSQFIIQKVYVKDISFETPDSPATFKAEWKPSVDININNEASPMGDNLFDVTLSITISVSVKNSIAYLVEVKQAGIFYIDKIPESIIERLLATACPNILFPFAREIISDMVTRGGFPQLLLSPVNFEALYNQQKSSAGSETKH